MATIGYWEDRHFVGKVVKPWHDRHVCWYDGGVYDMIQFYGSNPYLCVQNNEILAFGNIKRMRKL